jgi:hypothetical protein
MAILFMEQTETARVKKTGNARNQKYFFMNSPYKIILHFLKIKKRKAKKTQAPHLLFSQS